MKVMKYCFAAVAALVMLVSCDLPYIGDVDTDPDDNDPSGVVPPTDLSDARQVRSIEMTYTDNTCNPVEVTSYTQYFTYNEDGKCTRIMIDYADVDEDDLTCDITYGDNTIKFDVIGHHSPVSYLATLENGRAVSTTYSDPDEDRLMTFNYDADGYLSKITEWCPEHMSDKDGCGFVAFSHSEGLCTGAWFDVNPESAANADDALVWSPEKWYPNGYSDYKTNIDLNSFIIDGGIEYEMLPWTLLNTLRYLGKVSDCLAERTYAFISRVQSVGLLPGSDKGFPEPNTRYDRSYTTYEEVTEDFPVSMSFDADGAISEITYSQVYQQYRVDYYWQTTDEVLGDGYAATRSENTYTKIGGEISCPVELKVLY